MTDSLFVFCVVKWNLELPWLINQSSIIHSMAHSGDLLATQCCFDRIVLVLWPFLMVKYNGIGDEIMKHWRLCRSGWTKKNIRFFFWNKKRINFSISKNFVFEKQKDFTTKMMTNNKDLLSFSEFVEIIFPPKKKTKENTVHTLNLNQFE